MLFSLRVVLFHLLLGSLLLLSPAALRAQTAPHGYNFLTITAIESNIKKFSKLLYAPAFGGKAEVQLEALSSFSNATNLDDARRNAETINQSLSELTIAGWELVAVHVVPLGIAEKVVTTRYLFRKARP